MALNEYKSDKDKSEDGAWIDVGGMSFRILPASHKDTRKSYAKSHKKAYGEKRNPKNKPGKNDAILREVVSQVMVLDWKNVKLEDDGPDIPFTREKCIEIFGDIRYMEIVNDIFEEAGEADNFRAEQIQEDQEAVGN